MLIFSSGFFLFSVAFTFFEFQKLLLQQKPIPMMIRTTFYYGMDIKGISGLEAIIIIKEQ